MPHYLGHIMLRTVDKLLTGPSTSPLFNRTGRWSRHMGGIRKASSALACSGPNQGEPLEPRGHRVGSRDRLIAPAVRKMSPRPSPAAAAIIQKPQDDKLSITQVPVALAGPH